MTDCRYGRPTRRGTLARPRLGAALLACLVFIGAGSGEATAREADLRGIANRRGIAGPEEMPTETARCEDLREIVAGLDVPEGQRIDLWVSGPLTLVHTDDALWYLAICSEPGIRVMCVTYSDNGMKPGDNVLIRGGMRILDETHLVLDPCLASRD